MKKLIYLLKAAMSQDMDMFRYKTKASDSRTKQIIFPIILSLIVMFAVGVYAEMFALEFSKVNLTYIMLTLFIIFTIILTLVEGIYKSQGILFDAKDNDLLFSLPIEKSKILFVRIFKLLSFQFLYNALFMIPAYVVYIYYEHPGISFYLISILMTFLLPIIPTVISSIIGYVVKAVSVKFKAKKIVQTVFTMIIFFGIFYISLNTQAILENVINNAESINAVIKKVYYPAGAYIDLIQNFNLTTLLILIVVNIVPLVIFIMIASRFYFGIISKSSEKGKNKKLKNIESKVKVKSKLSALVSKELKRYFSSTVYIFNTSFGLILLLIVTIAMSVNINGVINTITEGEGIDINTIISLMPKIFFCLVTYTACMTSITSSSISLEGKSFNITKSLPTSVDTILLSKILMSCIITMPVILISDLIFFIAFKVGIIDILFILAISILMPILIAIIGLFTNLKYPKMNASSDTEVVKQSMSTTIAVFSGMILGLVFAVLMVAGAQTPNTNLFVLIELVALAVVVIALWRKLKKYSNKRFKEINV